MVCTFSESRARHVGVYGSVSDAITYAENTIENSTGEQSLVISAIEIGEVFYRLYDSEINIRFENLWDLGYTWAVTGYEGHPEPGEIRGKGLRLMMV